MTKLSTDLMKTKRSLFNYTSRVTAGHHKPRSKFVADMLFGILASGSTHLTEISRALREKTKPINTVDRLSRWLKQPILRSERWCHLQHMVQLLPERPIILVDDTDIVKPRGRCFESMARIRDGSCSSDKKAVIGNGYLCTEMVAVTKETAHPVSLYSHIHSPAEAGYKSTNVETYKGLNDVMMVLPKPATFVFDRGHDQDELFGYFSDEQTNAGKHTFIIRLKSTRLLTKDASGIGGWKCVSDWANRYKGTYRFAVQRWDSEKSKVRDSVVYVTAIRVRTRASAVMQSLLLVYRDNQAPMFLLTNADVQSKEACRRIVLAYHMRWRIEEYFRFKKQCYGFEDFRVRSLARIRHLNHLLTLALGWLGMMIEKSKSPSHAAYALLRQAKAIRETVTFYYYRLFNGVYILFRQARTGMSGFFQPRARPDPQMTMEQWQRMIA